jgi:hypothetical protein
VNQERKISALRNLLERVQKRAAAPRAPSVVSAPPMAIAAPPAQPQATSGRPGSSTLPLNFGSRPEAASFREAVDTASESPAAHVNVPSVLADSNPATPASRPLYDPGRSSAPEIEMEEGPPSAPRLREGVEDIEAEDEAIAEEHEVEEPQLKTPPPESGRQHVTPGPAATISEPDEDISITVSMEESEEPPPVSPARPEVAIPLSASRADISEQPRLALVSEPEIELHGMTPMAAMAQPIVPAKPSPVSQPGAFPSPGSRDIDLAMSSSAPSVPSATPSGVRPVPPGAPAPPPGPPAPSYTHPLAKTAQSAIADTKPSASVAVSAPPFIEAAPPTPPVRIMAQQLADASGKPLPPVEVWASSFAPAALRGEIATFVGQNANFEPKSFGELVRASIALGEEKP